MRSLGVLVAAAVVGCVGTAAFAVDGSIPAGPLGGADIRSAQLPPPGLYGGAIIAYAEARRFLDGDGNAVPALSALQVNRTRAGLFLLYVPDVNVLGGSIGLSGILPAGQECGRLFAATPTRCLSGFGDGYVEFHWSRFFGTMRPSRYPDALPVPEGLTIALGYGMTFPTGRYNVADVTTHGVAVGGNTWVFTPTIAATYVTPPIIADGTEFSAKLFWNNYHTNPTTQYRSGPLLNLNFAVTERIGRLQIGLAGAYAWQVGDDKRFNVAVPPDGRRLETLGLGGVLAFDIPGWQSQIKIKGLAEVLARNAPEAYGGVIRFTKKLL